MERITLKTIQIIDKLFDASEKDDVISFLTDYLGSSERIRFAALKVSNGSMEQLMDAVILAQSNWRDLLMWADFVHDVNAHNKWAATIV